MPRGILKLGRQTLAEILGDFVTEARKQQPGL